MDVHVCVYMYEGDIACVIIDGKNTVNSFKLHVHVYVNPQAADEYRQLQREGEELNNQMEEDTDQEILALKTHYERQLRQQTDENIKLRGDTGILRKKVISHMSSVCTCIYV